MSDNDRLPEWTQPDDENFACRVKAGVQGGHDGTFSQTTFNPDRENLIVGKVTLPLKKGDVIRLQTAGAGGYGNPFERDPEMVLNDVRNGKVSIKRAREVYGTVINEETMQVDFGETNKIRETTR